jgi:hypothetical protein
VSSLTTPNLFGVFPSTSTSSSADGTTGGTQQANGASRFVTAIQNAFASLGISLDGSSTTTSSTASSSTTDASSTSSTDTSSTSDAVTTFLQNLLAALQSQSPQSASSSTADASTTASDQSAQTSAVKHGHHHHGGKLEGDLQSLISQLTTSSDSTTNGSPTSTGTTDTTSGTSATGSLSSLENSFDAVLAQNGIATTSDTDTLATFLKSLASSLHGAPATGNVVSTAA